MRENWILYLYRYSIMYLVCIYCHIHARKKKIFEGGGIFFLSPFWRPSRCFDWIPLKFGSDIVNFFVFYKHDHDTSKHVLALAQSEQLSIRFFESNGATDVCIYIYIYIYIYTIYIYTYIHAYICSTQLTCFMYFVHTKQLVQNTKYIECCLLRFCCVIRAFPCAMSAQCSAEATRAFLMTLDIDTSAYVTFVRLFAVVNTCWSLKVFTTANSLKDTHVQQDLKKCPPSDTICMPWHQPLSLKQDSNFTHTRFIECNQTLKRRPGNSQFRVLNLLLVHRFQVEDLKQWLHAIFLFALTSGPFS